MDDGTALHDNQYYGNTVCEANGAKRKLVHPDQRRSIQNWLDSQANSYGAAEKCLKLSQCSSFEDDLNLGAEAKQYPAPQATLSMHLQQRLFGNESWKRRRRAFRDSNYQSLNSEGLNSDCSSCTSIEQILDVRKAKAEDVLMNLGFGTSMDQNLADRIPLRFLKTKSEAHGIDVNRFVCDNEDLQDKLVMEECLGTPMLGYHSRSGSRSASSADSQSEHNLHDTSNVPYRRVSRTISVTNEVFHGMTPSGNKYDSILISDNTQALQKQGLYDAGLGISITMLSEMDRKKGRRHSTIYSQHEMQQLNKCQRHSAPEISYSKDMHVDITDLDVVTEDVELPKRTHLTVCRTDSDSTLVPERWPSFKSDTLTSCGDSFDVNNPVVLSNKGDALDDVSPLTPKLDNDDVIVDGHKHNTTESLQTNVDDCQISAIHKSVEQDLVCNDNNSAIFMASTSSYILADTSNNANFKSNRGAMLETIRESSAKDTCCGEECINFVETKRDGVCEKPSPRPMRSYRVPSGSGEFRRPKLAKLRAMATEVFESFELEEIQSTDDIVGVVHLCAPLSRTVSMQSDSSGFADVDHVNFSPPHDSSLCDQFPDLNNDEFNINQVDVSMAARSDIMDEKEDLSYKQELMISTDFKKYLPKEYAKRKSKSESGDDMLDGLLSIKRTISRSQSLGSLDDKPQQQHMFEIQPFPIITLKSFLSESLEAKDFPNSEMYSNKDISLSTENFEQDYSIVQSNLKNDHGCIHCLDEDTDNSHVTKSVVRKMAVSDSFAPKPSHSLCSSHPDHDVLDTLAQFVVEDVLHAFRSEHAQNLLNTTSADNEIQKTETGRKIESQSLQMEKIDDILDKQKDYLLSTDETTDGVNFNNTPSTHHFQNIQFGQNESVSGFIQNLPISDTRCLMSNDTHCEITKFPSSLSETITPVDQEIDYNVEYSSNKGCSMTIVNRNVKESETSPVSEVGESVVAGIQDSNTISKHDTDVVTENIQMCKDTSHEESVNKYVVLDDTVHIVKGNVEHDTEPELQNQQNIADIQVDDEPKKNDQSTPILLMPLKRSSLNMENYSENLVSDVKFNSVKYDSNGSSELKNLKTDENEELKKYEKLVIKSKEPTVPISSDMESFKISQENVHIIDDELQDTAVTDYSILSSNETLQGLSQINVGAANLYTTDTNMVKQSQSSTNTDEGATMSALVVETPNINDFTEKSLINHEQYDTDIKVEELNSTSEVSCGAAFDIILPETLEKLNTDDRNNSQRISNEISVPYRLEDSMDSNSVHENHNCRDSSSKLNVCNSSVVSEDASSIWDPSMEMEIEIDVDQASVCSIHADDKSNSPKTFRVEKHFIISPVRIIEVDVNSSIDNYYKNTKSMTLIKPDFEENGNTRPMYEPSGVQAVKSQPVTRPSKWNNFELTASPLEPFNTSTPFTPPLQTQNYLHNSLSQATSPQSSYFDRGHNAEVTDDTYYAAGAINSTDQMQSSSSAESQSVADYVSCISSPDSLNESCYACSAQNPSTTQPASKFLPQKAISSYDSKPRCNTAPSMTSENVSTPSSQRRNTSSSDGRSTSSELHLKEMMTLSLLARSSSYAENSETVNYGVDTSSVWGLREMSHRQRLIEELQLVRRAIKKYKTDLYMLEIISNGRFEQAEDIFYTLSEEREQFDRLRQDIQIELDQLESSVSHRLLGLVSGEHVTVDLSSLHQMRILESMIELLKEQLFHQRIVEAPIPQPLSMSHHRRVDQSAINAPSLWQQPSHQPLRQPVSPQQAPLSWQQEKEKMLKELTELKQKMHDQESTMKQVLDDSFSKLKTSLLEEIQDAVKNSD